MDAKFQALTSSLDAPAAAHGGEAAATALGALALDKRRRPQRQNAYAHFRKARRALWVVRLARTS